MQEKNEKVRRKTHKSALEKGRKKSAKTITTPLK